MKPYRPLRRLQKQHRAWLAALLTASRAAVEAALRDLFHARPEVVAVRWNITRPPSANFAYIVGDVEFDLGDCQYHAGDRTVTGPGDPLAVRPKRYHALADLLHANGEVVATAVGCPVAVTATPDGRLHITTPSE
jgi:hypothetical protein